MIGFQITDPTFFIAFWLCFTRFIALFLQLPFFDNNNVPIPVKVLFSLFLSFSFFPFCQNFIIEDLRAVGMDNVWFLTIYYALVGLICGFLVKIIMMVFVASGSILAQQIGFTAASYFDPISSQRVGPVEKLIQWSMLILVISSGALIPMFKGAILTFQNLQFIDIFTTQMNSEFFLKTFKDIFSSAILLSTPIIFTNLLLYLILGIIARTVPQMNVLMVSFVLNIGIGVMVFLMTMGEYFHVAFNIYVQQLGNWFNFIV